MKLEILKSETVDDGHKQRVTVRIPGAEKTVAVRDALVEFAKQARIVPGDSGDIKSAIVSRVGEDEAAKLITTFVVQAVAAQVINELDLHIMFDPRPVRTPIEGLFEDGDGEVCVELVLRPEFELKNYDPVDVMMPAHLEVNDAMLQSQIDEIMAQHADYVEAEGPFQEGDYVKVDMETSVDGEPAPGLTAEGLRIGLVEGQMPNGFIQNVIGMQPGDEREFSFSEVAPGMPLDAKPTEFTFKVKAVERRERVIPEITDEFVEKNFIGMGNTVEAFKGELRRQMEEQLNQELSQQRESMVDGELARRLDGRLPDLYIERARDELVGQLQAQAASQGMTIEQMIQQQGMEQQQFGMMIAMQARENLRQVLALDAYARHFGIDEVTDEDIADTLSAMAPGREAELRANFDKNGAWFVVRDTAIRRKAHKKALAEAKFVDFTPKPAPEAEPEAVPEDAEPDIILPEIDLNVTAPAAVEEE